MEDGKVERIWKELYEAAKAVQNPRDISERIYAGGVAAAIESASGRIIQEYVSIPRVHLEFVQSEMPCLI